jgi:peptide/nickel transport system permease protein
MFAFIVRRMLIAIPIVLLSSFLVFMLVAASGDPLEDLRLRPGIQPSVVEARERELGLDKPLPERYWNWLTDFVQGDFGKNLKGQEVRPQITRALGLTLRLVLISSLIAVLIGLTVGVISAVRQYSAFDYGSTFFSFLFFAMPVFWFAVLLKEFGAIRLNETIGDWGLKIFTIGSESTPAPDSLLNRLWDYAGHAILPIITLAVISYAAYSRFTRASMLETMSSDYVRTAKAKGLSNKRVIFRHAFRTALIPVITLIAIDFGLVLGGAFITENIFAYNGMGTLFRNALLPYPDPNPALAYLMITALMVVIFNLLADIAYAYLDPRIRLD